jgi:predicted small secreted protein
MIESEQLDRDLSREAASIPELAVAIVAPSCHNTIGFQRDIKAKADFYLDDIGQARNDNRSETILEASIDLPIGTYSPAIRRPVTLHCETMRGTGCDINDVFDIQNLSWHKSLDFCSIAYKASSIVAPSPDGAIRF